jgi:hypothetical protein
MRWPWGERPQRHALALGEQRNAIRWPWASNRNAMR